MATQRLTVAAVLGTAGTAVAELFHHWRAASAKGDDDNAVRRGVDHFGEQLRTNGITLPVVYFCEWIDRWLMGNRVPGPGAVAGGRFEATCGSAAEAMAWAAECGDQFPEQEWLASRLREAAEAVAAFDRLAAVVVLREALGVSATDEEIRASGQAVPGWLTKSGYLSDGRTPLGGGGRTCSN